MQSLGYVPDLELEDEEIWTIRCLRTPRVGFRDLSLSLTQFLLQLSKKRPEEYIFLFKLVESRVEGQMIPSVSFSCNGKISETTLPGYPKDILRASVARNAAKATACASKEGYNDLPAYMRNLVVWEELREAAVKINSFLSRLHKQNDAFNQDELEKMAFSQYSIICSLFEHKGSRNCPLLSFTSWLKSKILPDASSEDDSVSWEDN